MVYSTSFGSIGTGRGGGNGTTKNTQPTSFGRVLSVVLDAFHPDYDKYGKSQSINGVVFRKLNELGEEAEDSEFLFAYCGSETIKKIPLKNEIVQIYTLPSENREIDPDARKNYWRHIIPLWNHPHHNAYPDTNQDKSQESKADLGDYFTEEDKIGPLQPFPGDVIIEGRHGQSIRLNGTKYDSNEWTDDSNNGKPVTIISNGIGNPKSGTDLVIEDINKDPGTIFMASDHKLPIKPGNSKQAAFVEEPEKPETYKGKQILIASGRLYFNSYEESAFISAKEEIGLNGKKVAFDGVDYVSMDAKKIYLGNFAQKEKNPVLLGEVSTTWMDSHLSLFEAVVSTLSTLPPAPPAAVAALIAIGNAVKPQIPVIRNQLPQLHSKKVFTE